MLVIDWKQAESPFRATEDKGMEKFEDNVRERKGLGHCEYACVVPGFAIQNSQLDESFVDNGT